MRKILICDVTLRESQKNNNLSFKEKIEIAAILDKLKVDVIETAPIINGRTDVLYLHTIAPWIKNSILCCPANLSSDSVKEVYEHIKEAGKKRIKIPVPVSTVQMEYTSHMKPKKLLEALEETLKTAKELFSDIEVALVDSTRGEKEFLYTVIKSAISGGASTITLCDSACEFIPSEFEEFLKDIKKNVSEIESVNLSAECGNELSMASACAISCIKNGVNEIKVGVSVKSCPELSNIASILRAKGNSLGAYTDVNTSILDNCVNKIKLMKSEEVKYINNKSQGTDTEIKVTDNDDFETVSGKLMTMGYELSSEDVQNVYNELMKFAKTRSICAKEIDAVVASVAMQVTPTYKLKSYVINNGNIISSTAHMVLEKNNKDINGICIGDGPVDAAFRAIEQIFGNHIELDDFQIQSITEGREALGSSVVKLRYNNKSYSGKGISTDIVGASINAYINALNKICFEEGII